MFPTIRIQSLIKPKRGPNQTELIENYNTQQITSNLEKQFERPTIGYSETSHLEKDATNKWAQDFEYTSNTCKRFVQKHTTGNSKIHFQHKHFRDNTTKLAQHLENNGRLSFQKSIDNSKTHLDELKNKLPKDFEDYPCEKVYQKVSKMYFHYKLKEITSKLAQDFKHNGRQARQKSTADSSRAHLENDENKLQHQFFEDNCENLFQRVNAEVTKRTLQERLQRLIWRQKFQTDDDVTRQRDDVIRFVREHSIDVTEDPFPCALNQEIELSTSLSSCYSLGNSNKPHLSPRDVGVSKTFALPTLCPFNIGQGAQQILHLLVRHLHLPSPEWCFSVDLLDIRHSLSCTYIVYEASVCAACTQRTPLTCASNSTRAFFVYIVSKLIPRHWHVTLACTVEGAARWVYATGASRNEQSDLMAYLRKQLTRSVCAKQRLMSQVKEMLEGTSKV